MSGTMPFQFPQSNPFAAFWTDFWGKMIAAGITPATPPQDMAEQLRRSFFDSMAKYADEFMRSEAFLASMKQSFDNALAWQGMMNQYLQKGLNTAQMPTVQDTAEVVTMVRGLEERLFARLENLAARIEKIERATTEKSGDKAEKKSKAGA